MNAVKKPKTWIAGTLEAKFIKNAADVVSEVISIAHEALR
jgi:hypothetical protein